MHTHLNHIFILESTVCYIPFKTLKFISFWHIFGFLSPLDTFNYSCTFCIRISMHSSNVYHISSVQKSLKMLEWGNFCLLSAISGAFSKLWNLLKCPFSHLFLTFGGNCNVCVFKLSCIRLLYINLSHMLLLYNIQAKIWAVLSKLKTYRIGNNIFSWVSTSCLGLADPANIGSRLMGLVWNLKIYYFPHPGNFFVDPTNEREGIIGGPNSPRAHLTQMGDGSVPRQLQSTHFSNIGENAPGWT